MKPQTTAGPHTQHLPPGRQALASHWAPRGKQFCFLVPGMDRTGWELAGHLESRTCRRAAGTQHSLGFPTSFHGPGVLFVKQKNWCSRTEALGEGTPENIGIPGSLYHPLHPTPLPSPVVLSGLFGTDRNDLLFGSPTALKMTWVGQRQTCSY